MIFFKGGGVVCILNTLIRYLLDFGDFLCRRSPSKLLQVRSRLCRAPSFPSCGGIPPECTENVTNVQNNDGRRGLFNGQTLNKKLTVPQKVVGRDGPGRRRHLRESFRGQSRRWRLPSCRILGASLALRWLMFGSREVLEGRRRLF